mgnify:CR=1 FL=1|jgi:tryptophanyl-tRNA synthetase
MKNVVSGIQPTGQIHIGNYLGSLKNWVKLQDDYKCFFTIVDLHAITANHETKEKFRKDILLTAATYLACGIDPKKSCIFQQSDVPSHAELFWLLSCLASMGKLNRMTQFKDKSGKDKQKASLGLYAYPILMAADILIYKADMVPVGEDQIQHLELTNDIATSFNLKYNVDYFKQVTPLITDNTKRIMSLRDGTNKMSKSDPSEMTRICLTDSDDEISLKLKRAKTDSEESLSKDIRSRPELKNLLTIYAGFSDISFTEVVAEFKDLNFLTLKTRLADLLISKISPIRNQIAEIYEDKTYLQNVLTSAATSAKEESEANLAEIKKIIGFIE